MKPNRVKRIYPKRKATYNIDDNTLFEFNKVCEKKSINKSSWIENQMVKFINKNEEEK